jgi:hypothetical protein
MSPLRNETQRSTVPSLPNPAEKDFQKVIQQLNNTILDLYKRDSDKEQRIRILETKK